MDNIAEQLRASAVKTNALVHEAAEKIDSLSHKVSEMESSATEAWAESMRQKVKELEDQLFTTTEHFKCSSLHNSQLTDELVKLRIVQGELISVLKDYDGSRALDQWDEDLMPSRAWEEELKAAIIKYSTESPSFPNNWLKICTEEIQRGKLTSHPLKFAFAKERGMKGLDEVHDWMCQTRLNFINMVETAAPNPGN